MILVRRSRTKAARNQAIERKVVLLRLAGAGVGIAIAAAIAVGATHDVMKSRRDIGWTVPANSNCEVQHLTDALGPADEAGHAPPLLNIVGFKADKYTNPRRPAEGFREAAGLASEPIQKDRRKGIALHRDDDKCK